MFSKLLAPKSVCSEGLSNLWVTHLVMQAVIILASMFTWAGGAGGRRKAQTNVCHVASNRERVKDPNLCS